jgi:hypothetical protein
MTDAERVLSLLLHDIRTPLGVAHGYLRLIRDDRLPTPEDHEKAFTGTQQALSRISRLCADAGAFVADGDGTATTASDAPGRARAAQLVDRVADTLTTQGVEVSVGPAPEAQVAVGSSLDRVADALATLLMTKAKPASGAVVRIDAEAGTLRFTSVPARPATVSEPQPGDAASPGGERPFDPWQSGQGLTVALAHRVVTRLGGRVWTMDGARAIAMTVPMESGAA